MRAGDWEHAWRNDTGCYPCVTPRQLGGRSEDAMKEFSREFGAGDVTRTRDLLITNHHKPRPVTSAAIHSFDIARFSVRRGSGASAGIHPLGCQIGCQGGRQCRTQRNQETEKNMACSLRVGCGLACWRFYRVFRPLPSVQCWRRATHAEKRRVGVGPSARTSLARSRIPLRVSR